MSNPLRCRTLLYTPADRPERYGKAWAEGAADIVCADLEDAVPPAGKAAARKAVREALKAPANPNCQRAVRINPIGSKEHEADLKLVLEAGPDLVVVPKCTDPEALAGSMARIEREAAGATRVVAILETAAGIVHAREICAVAGLAAVCFGAEDLAADVGMQRTASNQEVLMARQWVVLCAAAAGIPAIDMITPDYKDPQKTKSDAQQSRTLGFRGKMCIHPAQVPAVHEAFKPNDKDVQWARKILAAVEDAGIGKGGVITVDGTMVDVPVIMQAKQILANVN
jgi:citrate lyase subunit beta / citryl-CoA lyase